MYRQQETLKGFNVNMILVLAILSLSLVTTHSIVEDTSERAFEHGLNISPEFRRLSEVLAQLEKGEDGEDLPPVLVFEIAKDFFEEKEKDPSYDRGILNTWSRVSKSKTTNCTIEAAEQIQLNVGEADAEWHRIRSRWQTYEPIFTVQKLILQNAYDHALVCEKVYGRQHDEFAKEFEQTNTHKFTDDLVYYLRKNCMPGRNWLQLRPGLESTDKYYECVRDTILTENLPILRRALRDNSKIVADKSSRPLDDKTLLELAWDGETMCRSYVKKFDSLFNLAAWEADSFANKIFGESNFNKSWVISGTCKELLKKGVTKIVAALKKEGERRYSVAQS